MMTDQDSTRTAHEQIDGWEDLKLRHLPIVILAGIVALVAVLLWPDEEDFLRDDGSKTDSTEGME